MDGRAPSIQLGERPLGQSCSRAIARRRGSSIVTRRADSIRQNSASGPELHGAMAERLVGVGVMSLRILWSPDAGLGEDVEALAASQEATAVATRLQEAGLESAEPELAQALTFQAHSLGALGRPEEALAAMEQAMPLFWKLAGQ